MKSTIQHIQPDELFLYVERNLSKARALEIADHLSGCPYCQASKKDVCMFMAQLSHEEEIFFQSQQKNLAAFVTLALAIDPEDSRLKADDSTKNDTRLQPKSGARGPGKWMEGLFRSPAGGILTFILFVGLFSIRMGRQQNTFSENETHAESKGGEVYPDEARKQKFNSSRHSSSLSRTSKNGDEWLTPYPAAEPTIGVQTFVGFYQSYTSQIKSASKCNPRMNEKRENRKPLNLNPGNTNNALPGKGLSKDNGIARTEIASGSQSRAQKQKEIIKSRKSKKAKQQNQSRVHRHSQSFSMAKHNHPVAHNFGDSSALFHSHCLVAKDPMGELPFHVLNTTKVEGASHKWELMNDPATQHIMRGVTPLPIQPQSTGGQEERRKIIRPNNHGPSTASQSSICPDKPKPTMLSNPAACAGALKATGGREVSASHSQVIIVEALYAQPNSSAQFSHSGNTQKADDSPSDKLSSPAQTVGSTEFDRTVIGSQSTHYLQTLIQPRLTINLGPKAFKNIRFSAQ